MHFFPERSSEPEILDDFELEGNELSENLRELEKVNRFLGGYTVVKEGVDMVIASSTLSDKIWRVADVGCGAGDALRQLGAWALKRGIKLELLGVDANAAAIRYARQEARGYPNISFRQLNIHSPEFDDLQADILMFNLFLHHFTEEQIVAIISRARRLGAALIINDLQRSRLAYHGFRLISRILGFSYIGRHDGKLSVKKSFTKEDWQRIMEKAGVENYRLQWRWAFRYLIVIC